ncbi:MAG: hypothetical protein J0H54_00170, partial [Rhizobiales bacterium]|nr:hypothetical protein [Hyphomicrobiales bacterium]
MLIEARLAPAAARLWQLHVVERLAALPGNTVVVAPVPAARLPRGAEALLALEGLVARGRGVGGGARVGADAFARYLRPSEGPADLIVDLVGSPEAAGSAPVIDIDCDGEAPEAGALGAALDGAAPLLATRLRDAGGERVLSRWRPAVESPWSLAASFDMILGRAAHMIVREVGRMGRGSGEAAPRPAPHSRRSAGSFFLASLEARIARRLARTLGRAPNWYVAWRSSAADPEAIPDLAGPFRRLADDGARFYADPFLWCAGG